MTPELKTKIQKTLKGAAIASGGVFLTFILQAISTWDFGTYSAIIAGISSVLINGIKEFSRNYHE